MIFFLLCLALLIVIARFGFFLYQAFQPRPITQEFKKALSTENVDPILKMSATEIASQIKSGKLKSVFVVSKFIQRIKQINPHLNAMVKDRFELALKEASAADSKTIIDPENLGPFHGVPISIKECFALEGMPNSAGLVSRKNYISKEDSTAVKRLRAAGFIPVGVTNTSELCMWMESSNKLYGITRNGYDPNHIVGGSSGGEAAIVSALGAPVGLGSDIGGSIRMPAFFCGVFGHKPTGGRVPGSGQFPVATGPALRYLTTGPICRHSEDLFPMLKILEGPDNIDGGCFKIPLGDPNSVKLENLTVYNILGNGSLSVSSELIDSQNKVAEFLKSRGAKVETIKIPLLKNSLAMWSSLMTLSGGPSFTSLMGNGIESGVETSNLVKLFNLMIGKSEHTFPAIGLGILEQVTHMMDGQNKQNSQLAETLKKELRELLKPNTIILYPSYTSVAPRHHVPLLVPICWQYTAIWNVMELPVTQVPLGLNSKGLPLGIQIVAASAQDHLTIGVAKFIESQFGGWSEMH